MRAFLSELRRRNVYKVGAAYAVVGWILTQVGSILFPTFGAPDWVLKVFTLLVVLGFPVALVFAWAFELTPDGIRRTEDVPRRDSIAPGTGRTLDFAIIGLLVAALGISLSLQFTSDPGGREASIAVLPFTNLGNDPQHAGFTDGIHDEILTSLGNIGSLKVISRTSVMQYRETPKTVGQIGGELGVATVLEGSVRRAGDMVRITVQLIDARTDEHIWANTYDRELSPGNIFAIQSEIASTIAETLEVTLTPREKQQLAKAPTDNMEAYALYLAGRQNLYQREVESVQRARALFEQAIDLDPAFAKAYAGLSDTLILLSVEHLLLYADEAFSKSSALLEKAFALQSDDADIYASLGLLKMSMWRTNRQEVDAVQAEDAFQQALALSPNHGQAMSWYAGFASDRGDYTKAIELRERSVELDPLALVPQLQLGNSYAHIGDQQRALDRWLEISRQNPDWSPAPLYISTHLAGLGRLDEALAWWHRFRLLTTDPVGTGVGVHLYMEFGQANRAVELLNALPKDRAFSMLPQAVARRLQGDFAGARALLDGALARFEHPPPLFLSAAAQTALLQEDFAAARGYLERLCLRGTGANPESDNATCTMA